MRSGAQSASISSNQSPSILQFSRRPSTISPLSRQQNQQLLLVCQVLSVLVARVIEYSNFPFAFSVARI